VLDGDRARVFCNRTVCYATNAYALWIVVFDRKRKLESVHTQPGDLSRLHEKLFTLLWGSNSIADFRYTGNARPVMSIAGLKFTPRRSSLSGLPEVIWQSTKKCHSFYAQLSAKEPPTKYLATRGYRRQRRCTNVGQS
jgi:hypothetical protein